MVSFVRSVRYLRALVVGFILALVSFRAPYARAQTSVAKYDTVALERALADHVERVLVLQAAVVRNPAVVAAEQRAQALQTAARAEGSLPPPEAMAQVWQVPIARPYALRSQMVMLGISQAFPAAGALAAREKASNEQARAERAKAGDRQRLVAREADHAFAEYVEASARHRIHQEHLALSERVRSYAQAKHGAGGSLADVAQADVDLARMEADLVNDAAQIESARGHLNALLLRDAAAPLGPPVVDEPSLPSWDTQTLLAKAHASRPELHIAEAERAAREHEARAAECEAMLPSFTVGALYFPPTELMPQHGYGFSGSVSLPWLGAAAHARRDAGRQALVAATTDVAAARVPIDVEVVTLDANARSAGLRLRVLRDRALPAAHRAFDAVWSGYTSSRTDIALVLSARRAVVDVEEEIVKARAALDHARADLEAAVGTPVAMRPIAPLDPNTNTERGQHGDP